jgi:hypothetical protein
MDIRKSEKKSCARELYDQSSFLKKPSEDNLWVVLMRGYTVERGSI